MTVISNYIFISLIAYANFIINVLSCEMQITNSGEMKPLTLLILQPLVLIAGRNVLSRETYHCRQLLYKMNLIFLHSIIHTQNQTNILI